MQNAECRTQNAESRKRRGEDLSARLLQYGARILRAGVALPRTEEGLHVRRQMLHSGTSAGANCQEARAAESRADFLHKMQIVLKELRETDYWLRLIVASELMPEGKLPRLAMESDELIATVVRSLTTAIGNARHEN